MAKNIPVAFRHIITVCEIEVSNTLACISCQLNRLVTEQVLVVR